MAVSITQLRAAMSRSQAVQTLLAYLQAAGFDTTGWSRDSKQRQYLTAFATVWADLTELARTLAGFGFNRYAKGPALHEYSKSHYNNTVIPAVKTVGPIRLTQSGTVAHTIEVGQLRFRANTGAEFINITGGAIAGTPGATLDLTIEAVLAGAHGNVANGSITTLVTPLAGITCNNNISSPWYTTPGQDEESDSALQERNETQWATIGFERTLDAVLRLARAASDQVGRVGVNDQNPRGAGTVDIYIAGASGVITDSAIVAAVQAYFDARVFANATVSPRRWQVFASNAAAINVAGTIYYDPAFQPSVVLAEAEQALQDFINSAPLGGYSYAPGPTHVIARNDLIALVESVEGVLSFELTTPSSNISISSFEAPIPGTFNLSMTAVTS